MRILDRYVVRQLVPVWIWCIIIFVFVTVLIDLFGHLEEILRYHIPPQIIWHYYLNFTPLVFVQASPLALLLSTAFITTRLVRYQELLAMHVGGMSLLRAGMPFLFVGWLVSVLIFAVNERVVPQTSAVYERLRYETFRETQQDRVFENVATLDRANRLYHARLLDPAHRELEDLTILEHDASNQPTLSLYTPRAIFTRHGWLLLNGRISHLGPRGTLVGDPMPFVERLIPYPVTIESFRQPIAQPATMRYGELRALIRQLKAHGITNVRRYAVDLAAKMTLPLTNLLVCLIAFVGSTRRQGRTNMRGLGSSLGWGILYYLGVAASHGMGKEGFLPVVVAVWLPHLVALWACVRVLRRTT